MPSRLSKYAIEQYLVHRLPSLYKRWCILFIESANLESAGTRSKRAQITEGKGFLFARLRLYQLRNFYQRLDIMIQC